MWDSSQAGNSRFCLLVFLFSLDVKTTTFFEQFSVWGQHINPFLFLLIYFGVSTLPDILCCSVKSYYSELQYGFGCWVFAAFNLGFLKKHVKEGSSAKPVWTK